MKGGFAVKITSSYAVEIKKQKMFDNIGARYFVRELLKPLPAMVRSQLSANVPDVERRIQVTLATLKVLYPELKKLGTQAA